MSTALTITIQLIAIILGSAASIVSALVLYNLKNLNSRVSTTESHISALLRQKQDCQRDFVSSENFVRNEAYTRAALDAISRSLSELKGSFKVIEQMPQICGEIARQTVKAMKEIG